MHRKIGVARTYTPYLVVLERGIDRSSSGRSVRVELRVEPSGYLSAHLIARLIRGPPAVRSVETRHVCGDVMVMVQ